MPPAARALEGAYCQAEFIWTFLCESLFPHPTAALRPGSVGGDPADPHGRSSRTAESNPPEIR